MSDRNDRHATSNRRGLLKGIAFGSAALGAAGAGLFADADPRTGALGLRQARAATPARASMAFIQWQPHTVPAAWSKGIEEVLKTQQVIDYKLLDGQNKVEVQVSLMDTLINQGTSVIFLQPIDSVALAPSIAKAKRAGIAVITLNIDATEPHAAHVEMNHYFGAMDIARALGDRMGGKGEVVILNAPPGIIIRDQRTNGFVEGLKKHHPGIKIVADQVADWSRKKAQDVLTTLLAANPNVGGVYGVNDSMALGAVDVAKAKGLLGKMVIFGNDGEKDALESIEKGELTGTQYTDVYQQGRFAASAAAVLASGLVPATAFKQQGRLLMPYVIATKDNVSGIQPSQRW
jgi:ABC-type sugar transport system substrate-binding protein